VFVSFLSKNENKNSFDLVGLISFLVEYRRVVYYLYAVVFKHCFSGSLALD